MRMMYIFNTARLREPVNLYLKLANHASHGYRECAA